MQRTVRVDRRGRPPQGHSSVAPYDPGKDATAIGSGLVILLIGLPFVHLVHHRPDSKGEHPDGIAEPTRITPHGDGGPDFTPSKAMRTRAFWFVSIGHALALLTVSTVMVHMVPTSPPKTASASVSAKRVGSSH